MHVYARTVAHRRILENLKNTDRCSEEKNRTECLRFSTFSGSLEYL